MEQFPDMWHEEEYPCDFGEEDIPEEFRETQEEEYYGNHFPVWTL